jgi:hypothetical protein
MTLHAFSRGLWRQKPPLQAHLRSNNSCMLDSVAAPVSRALACNKLSLLALMISGRSLNARANRSCGSRTNEPNPAKMAVDRGEMSDERSQSCQNGGTSGGGSGEMRRTKPRNRPPRVRSARRHERSHGATHTARERRERSQRGRPARERRERSQPGAYLCEDDPCRNGVRLGTRSVSMHAVEDGA